MVVVKVWVVVKAWVAGTAAGRGDEQGRAGCCARACGWGRCEMEVVIVVVEAARGGRAPRVPCADVI